MGSRVLLGFGFVLSWLVLGVAALVLVLGVVALPFLVWRLEFESSVRLLVTIWLDSFLLIAAAMFRDSFREQLATGGRGRGTAS